MVAIAFTCCPTWVAKALTLFEGAGAELEEGETEGWLGIGVAVGGSVAGLYITLVGVALGGGGDGAVP